MTGGRKPERSGGRSKSAGGRARRGSEKALRESEAIYHDLIERANDGITIVQDDVIAYTNPRSNDILGYAQDEVVGTPISRYIHPDELPGVIDRYRRRMAGEHVEPVYETALVRRDGSRVEVELNAGVITYEGRPANMVTVRDITERKRAKTALRESEERFRRLVEDMNDGYCVVQGAAVAFANVRVAEMFGYDPQEVLGKTVQELLPPEIVTQLATMYSKRSRGEAVPAQYEATVVRKDGTECPVEFGVRKIEYAGGPAFSIVIRDITERRQAEKELHHQERVFRSLIENSLDAVAILNSDGTVRYESPSVERVLGYKPEELMGQNVIDHLHPDDVSSVNRGFEASLKDAGHSVSMVVRFKHKDGSWRTVEGVGNNLLDDPDVNGIVVNFRDLTDRKKAEQALRESEEKYRNVVERANDGIVIIQDSNIKYINSRAAEGLGYTVDQVIGTPITDYVHPDRLAEAVERYQRRMAGEDIDSISESVLVNRNGDDVHVETNAALINYEGRPASMVILRNITERKAMEEAIRVSEAYYRLLAENITDIVWTLNMDLQYTYMSPSVLRLRGFTPEEAMSLRLQDAMTPDSYQIARQALREELEIEKREDKDLSRTRTLELEMRCKDGSTVWTEVDMTFLRNHEGTAVGILGVTRDIADRKRIEETLRQSEEKLARYLESSPDGIYVSDLSGTFLYGNREAERITGYSRDQLMGKSFLEVGLLPEKYFAKAAKTLEVNMSGKPTGPLELELVRKDGSLIPVEISTYPIGEGDSAEVIGIARDISERKRAEQDRQRMEQQVHLAGRLAAVGELAAGVAHELNNPLAAVQAYAQFLTSRGVDESLKGDLETIYREAQRASRITSNLLSFARRHMPEKSLISINEAVESSLELHAYRMRVNNIHVSTDLARNLPQTLADFHQLQQVFVNLISNAEQAMTEAHGQGNLVVSTRKVGNTVHVVFTDDGPGIPKETLKRMFDPFYTTKEVGKGTGLGLSISFGIVDAHGGRLHARSKPGKGATFVVEIPIVKEEEKPQRAGAIPA